MKEGIHPKWFPESQVTCQCGNSWTVGSTVPRLVVDVCSACHPFYTGEQRIVDTEGQVDRFVKRLEARTKAATAAPESVSGLQNISLSELNLGRQFTELLANNGIATAQDFINKLQDGGDDAVLEIRGVGRKLLTDIKKRLKARGFELPVTTA
jgi:large subunit ribosomal protein L31